MYINARLHFKMFMFIGLIKLRIRYMNDVTNIKGSGQARN